MGRPRGTLFFVCSDCELAAPRHSCVLKHCVFRWPAQARARRHRRRPASPRSHSSHRVIGPRTSSNSPRRQNSSKFGALAVKDIRASGCTYRIARARRSVGSGPLGCVSRHVLSVLVFGWRRQRLTGPPPPAGVCRKYALTLQLQTAHILSAHATLDQKMRSIQDLKEQKNK
jgi:hypothetical protein